MSPEDARIENREAGEAATVVRPPPAAAHGMTPGTLLVNTYRVERLLGGGGMGEVYLARHAGLGTQHAIKVIRPSLAQDRQVMDLFYREARVLRGVRHEAVVSYDGFVRDQEGRDYLVMEYVEGPSLAERLRRGPLTPAEVLALRDRLAAGLAEAHRKGAVHRDLSPDNVILPGERIESAKLIDFGICKLTDPAQETIIGSSFAGKYRYASPEQLGLYGGGVDARSDIYSLGLILAAAALGRPLGMGESIEAALRSRQGLPDLSALPPSLREWLSAMLQPDPARRPDSLDALLARWPASGETAPGRTGWSPGPREARAGRGLRLSFWAPGLVLLLGVAGGMYWLLRPLPGPGPATIPGPPEGDAVGSVKAPPAEEGASMMGPEPKLQAEAPATQAIPQEGSVQPEPGLAPEDEQAGEREPPQEPVVRSTERPSALPGARFSDPLSVGGHGPVMVWLPPGEFQLGSPPGEPGRNPDEQGYEARVPEPIAFGETEVTLWQYRQFVQETGYRTEVERDSTCLRPDENWQELVPDMSLSWESPGYEVNPGHPVSCVSWNDARAYAQWLTEQTGHLYRLPTELEWEYAARAGTQASRYWGDDPRAGCTRANTAECDDDYRYTAVAGTFPPNPFGLRDMLGNLAEWTCSEYSKGYGGSEGRCSDGGGSLARVFRGGSWLDAPDLVRAAARDGAPPNLGLNTVGFRLVRGLPPGGN
jgi:formylglycine-generating enzyme required for sulfatase activity/predicted Ser/Thr protein kinase